MATINLSITSAETHRVVVESLGSDDKPDHRQGNLEVLRGAAVTWKALSNPGVEVKEYAVSFVNLSNGKPTWPFVEQADGTTGKLPDNYTGPIILKPGKSVSLTSTTGGGEKVKYLVAATRNSGTAIDPCDPMLIIRPTLNSKVTFGLVCALAGALVGALLASRPWQ